MRTKNPLEPPLCACGCGLPVKEYWNGPGWNKFIYGHHGKNLANLYLGKNNPNWKGGKDELDKPSGNPTACACGCGKFVLWNKENRCWNTYLHGHGATHLRKSFSGSNNPSWKGGEYTDAQSGRVMVLDPNQSSGYIARARFVMEQHIGRRLTRFEIAHHKNEIITDDRIENLELLTLSEHSILHNSGPRSYHFGKHLSEETKRKISETNKLRVDSEETRKRKSRSALLSWERRRQSNHQP